MSDRIPRLLRGVAPLAVLLVGGCKESAKDSGDPTDSGDSADTAFIPADCSHSTGWTFVAAGSMISCGVHTDGCAECWGHEHVTYQTDTASGPYYDSREDTPPAVSFRSINLPNASTYFAPGLHGCGLAADDTIACWGRDDADQAEPPSGSFQGVDVIDTGSCGLTAEGSIVCWGDTMDPPEGTYTALSIGDMLGLALDGSGRATAWVVSYSEWDGLPEVTPGPFTAVAMGTFACGLRPDGTLACWYPANADGSKRIAAITPAGTYTQVAAGSAGACALDAKGRAVCFSEDPKAEILQGIPENSFTQLSVSIDFACGVTTDQRILCWGNNDYGQASPPE